MPHVAFVPFTGLRVRDQEMLELGMTLPGLHERATTISHLPALGLLTLAGMLPSHWTCSYHSAATWDDELVAQIREESPTVRARASAGDTIHVGCGSPLARCLATALATHPAAATAQARGGDQTSAWRRDRCACPDVCSSAERFPTALGPAAAARVW
jgi:hypothetical protein